jgi:hypothetical protein
MDTHIIKIEIKTDMDQSQLFDIILEMSERIVDEIESYDEEAEIDESQVSVSLHPTKRQS